MTITHNWSGWPGAYCMGCGNEDSTEDALCCRECDLKTCPEDQATDKMCAFHEAWAQVLRTGCPPDREAVRAFKEKYAERFGDSQR